MLIHINLKNFLTGTLILFMGVPFCFGQHLSFPRWTSGESNQHFISSLSLQTERNNLMADAFSERHAFHLKDMQDSLKSDTTLRKPVFNKFRMKKSPWLAVGLSAILPGAGQFYNRSYWKVPVLLGIAGYLGYKYYDEDKKYRDYRDQYAATQTPENLAGDENLKTLREFYRNQRNDFVWYFAIVYVINLIDAYVDAHLFDFTVKEDKIERFGTVDKEYKLNVKVRL